MLVGNAPGDVDNLRVASSALAARALLLDVSNPRLSVINPGRIYFRRHSATAIREGGELVSLNNSIGVVSIGRKNKNYKDTHS